MNVTEALRQYLRDAHAKSGKGVLAFEHSLGFSKSALKAVLSEQYNQVPSLDKAEKIAEALGLELYLGPPRSDNITSIPTTVDELGPADVVAFETGALKGSVLAEIEVSDGVAKLVLSPEDAKALADQLTHRAMQIEESE